LRKGGSTPKAWPFARSNPEPAKGFGNPQVGLLQAAKSVRVHLRLCTHGLRAIPLTECDFRAAQGRSHSSVHSYVASEGVGRAWALPWLALMLPWYAHH